MIDYAKLRRAESLLDLEDEDKFSLSGLTKKAKKFLLSQHWCKQVDKTFIGMAYEGIIGVFYAEIEPTDPRIDRGLWVVVGDLPSAYLVTDRSPDAASAVESYIVEMRDWVDAARNGLSVKDLIPVNVEPTKEYAELLESRLDFLEQRILPHFRSGDPDHAQEFIEDQ